MKTKITTVFMAFLLMAGLSIFAQSEQSSKLETVTIKTSAVCQDCKDRIEHDMAFEKGVKSVTLDLETKELTITFKKGKNTKENLKKAVTKIGYDADDLIAEQKPYENLPACCKKDAAPH